MKILNKILLICYVIIFCCIAVEAQDYKAATDVQRKELIDKITQSSAEMKSMICDFTQIKELSFMDDKMMSEGEICFKKENKIRCEYTKPYKYVFSMDGRNVRTVSGDNTTTVPANSSKMFSEISKILTAGFTGNVFLNSTDFSAQLMIGMNDYKIILTPQQKEIKAIFSAIQLYIGKSNNKIKSIELVEKSGDKTTITLKNIKINATIDDSIFSN